MEAKRNSEIASLYYECMCVLLFCFVFFIFFREVKSSFYKYLKTSIIRGFFESFLCSRDNDLGCWSVGSVLCKSSDNNRGRWSMTVRKQFENLSLQDSRLIWNITSRRIKLVRNPFPYSNFYHLGREFLYNFHLTNLGEYFREFFPREPQFAFVMMTNELHLTFSARIWVKLGNFLINLM